MVRRIRGLPASEDPRWTSEVEPAPGELRIVQAFVNTADPWTKSDELASPQLLARWLARWRLTPEEIELTAADLERALALREGMRAVFWTHNGGKPAGKVLAAFDRAAAEVPLRLRADAQGATYLTAASAAAAGLGRLLGMFATARASELGVRLKVCADGRCGTAFYDESSGLRRKWCSARCSNRQAARWYRRRQGIRPRGKSRS